MKSFRIRSYPGPCFPAFGLNAKRYGVCFRIQSECRKIRPRITPNKDTFYAVLNGLNVRNIYNIALKIKMFSYYFQPFQSFTQVTPSETERH